MANHSFGSLGADKKVSKASVHYRPGTGQKLCGNCSMYDNHTCSLVAGLVRPDYVCDEWEKRDMSHKTFAEAGSSLDAHQQFSSTEPNWRHVLIARHGATHLNNDDTSVDRIRGWKDIPLSPEGVQEAHKLGDELSASPPDYIMSSDLRRASETAQIVSKYCNSPVVLVSKVFRPWNAGELAGKKSSIAVPIMADHADNKPDEPLPGGESYHSFLGRFFCGLHSALVAHPKGLPAIVTHHRNERSLQAWRAAGFPEDGEIDKKVFKEKGEGTAGVTPMDIPLDRLKLAADCHRKRMANK